MTEIGDTYRKRANAFARLIAATPPERWSSPSRAKGGPRRDVVAHVVDFSAQVLPERAAVAQPPSSADFDDPAAAFRATRAVIEGLLDDRRCSARRPSVHLRVTAKGIRTAGLSIEW